MITIFSIEIIHLNVVNDGSKFSLFIVSRAGKLNSLQWDLVCKSPSSVCPSRLWVEPLVHRPQTYLQAPLVAAKASFCSRNLSRDPLTAFRSDIVLLSGAHILSCSNKQIWLGADLPASKYANGVTEALALIVTIRRPVCRVQDREQETSAGRFSLHTGSFDDQTYSQSCRMFS